MITVITGLTGAGKTWLMSRLALKLRKQGEIIYPNLQFYFPNNNEGVMRWHHLSETYVLTKGIICIDEGQKLFNARRWMFLPSGFADKICSHRHQFIDIITTTQDLGHIDVRVRGNIHEVYHCRSIFRFPANERKQPYFQIISVLHKKRNFMNDSTISFVSSSRPSYRFISRFFTKKLYDTYANIDLSHYICQIKRDKKKWQINLLSRKLSSQSSRN